MTTVLMVLIGALVCFILVCPIFGLWLVALFIDSLFGLFFSKAPKLVAGVRDPLSNEAREYMMRKASSLPEYNDNDLKYMGLKK